MTTVQVQMQSKLGVENRTVTAASTGVASSAIPIEEMQRRLKAGMDRAPFTNVDANVLLNV